MTQEPIRVLVAEDSAIVSQALRQLLTKDGRIEIAGQAGSFTEMLHQCESLKPSIIIMDLRMADADQFAAGHIKSCMEKANVKLIATSSWFDDDTNQLAASYGADIFLDKARLSSQLVPAIMRLAQK